MAALIISSVSWNSTTPALRYIAEAIAAWSTSVPVCEETATEPSRVRPGLDGQDRLVRRDLRRHLEKRRGVLEALGLHHDRPRALVLAVVVEDLRHRQVALVAVGAVHAVAQPDVVQVQLEHLAHAAALGDDRDVARLHRHEGEVGVDRDLGVGVLDALGVGPEDAHAVLVGQLDHLALALDALLADLLEPGAVHDAELDALLPALLDDLRDQRGLDRDVDQVDLVRHVEHRLEALEAADVRAPWG